MTTHQVETVISENGVLNLQNLPFKKGDIVEVIIVELPQHTSISSLEGKVLYYHDPFESATDLDDWEALSYSEN